MKRTKDEMKKGKRTENNERKIEKKGRKHKR
jgi:hypothetical protein